MTDDNDDFDLIFSYSRADAIQDGVLIDVTETAREAGFRHPVALTAAAYGEYVAVPEGVTGQDQAGRLWDILHMLRFAIRRSRGGETIHFQLYVRNDEAKPAELVTLKALCGPGDTGEPVLTIMLPGED